MKPSLRLLCLCSLAAQVCAIANALAENSLVAVTGGKIRGEVSDDGSASFLGIPFAASPDGDRRWLAPQPLPSWQGVREAKASGPPCMQQSYGWNQKDAEDGREDCLYLDVRTPHLAPGAKLPVMVWIHGGANRAGSARGTTRSSIVNRGVVLVSIQYRLGPFGFMSHPELTWRSETHASGNYGLLDQIAALRWVQDNIAAFGGDPKNVTVFGHSAGAQDVALLLLAPRARNLFAKAIMQSGTAGFGLPPRTLLQNEQMGLQIARNAGASDIAGLRALKPEALLAATDTIAPATLNDASFIWLQAVVDRDVLPHSPAELFARREEQAVPLLIGNSVRELPLHGGAQRVREAIAEAFGGSNAGHVASLYGLDRKEPDDEVAMQLATDIMFRCPAVFTAKMHTAAGNAVWQYELARVASGRTGPVTHGSELPFVFDNLSVDAGNSPPISLQAYWVNFARTGNPNGDGMPVWPKYDGRRPYVEFGERGAVKKTDLRGRICNLLSNP